MATSSRELRERLDREQHGRAADWSGDDVGLVLLMLWVVSILQVAHTFARHEPFGTISTLALMSIVFLPAVIWRELAH